jgi:hypothetical protein
MIVARGLDRGDVCAGCNLLRSADSGVSKRDVGSLVHCSFACGSPQPGRRPRLRRRRVGRLRLGRLTGAPAHQPLHTRPTPPDGRNPAAADAREPGDAQPRRATPDLSAAHRSVPTSRSSRWASSPLLAVSRYRGERFFSRSVDGRRHRRRAPGRPGSRPLSPTVSTAVSPRFGGVLPLLSRCAPRPDSAPSVSRLRTTLPEPTKAVGPSDAFLASAEGPSNRPTVHAWPARRAVTQAPGAGEPSCGLPDGQAIAAAVIRLEHATRMPLRPPCSHDESFPGKRSLAALCAAAEMPRRGTLDEDIRCVLLCSADEHPSPNGAPPP